MITVSWSSMAGPFFVRGLSAERQGLQLTVEPQIILQDLGQLLDRLGRH